MSIAGRQNVLFIGNSITVHGKCSYWWGEWGMAASAQELDYVHQLIDKLKIRGGATNFKCFNFFAWEAMAYDRAETLQLMEGMLNEEWTKVIVQLGENVTDLTSLENDYGELVDFLAMRLPHSKIMLLDNVWNLPKSHDMKCRVAREKGISFVDLSDMWDDESLLCGLGTEVRGDDGKLHIVEHKGVAGHPGNAYMAEIAERLLRCIEQD